MLYLVFFLIKGFCIVFPFAERPGFEPGNRFGRLHAFQACLFSHSSISPSTYAHHDNSSKSGASYDFFMT